MISENVSFLKQYYPNIYNVLIKQNPNSSDFHLIESKSGYPTIQVQAEGISQLIHSKYDPLKEAARFIDQFSDKVKNYEHVLFYGVGLGYHIDEFMKRYPDYHFSLYEPNFEIFNLFTNHRNINKFPVHRLKDIFVEESREQGKNFLGRFTYEIQERILLIVLPSYQQIFKEQYQHFSEDFKEAVGQKRQAYYVDTLFSARWTLNSLINFPKTIQTQNILSDEYKERFKDKPLIIVSAGPSLEEEYENLRYIKENKLAYIFAVGSANRALIAQNIMPDAVCTYDPQGHNHNVFASMIEQGITSVPMIYGTSVGFETLNMYQGPKLHMVTSQDTVTRYYLKNKDGSLIDVVEDSPTIAAVAFQLAAKLVCNPIVFAGQNLAFKNNQFYSKDVEYKEKNRAIEVIEEDREKVLLISDVYGNQVETTPSFNNMRDNLEFQITRFPHVEVINTTKGGAAIAGTVFKTLDELIGQRFTKAEVDENWYSDVENKSDGNYTLDRIDKMERSVDSFRKLYWEIQSVLEEMNKSILVKKVNKLAKLSLKFDKLMKKFIVNESYLCYIQPVNRSQFQALSIRAANVRKQTNEIDRAKLLMNAFIPFLNRCKLTLEKIAGSIYKIHHEVKNETDKKYKFYSSDCGAYHYVGMWEKVNRSAGESIEYPVKQMVAKESSTLSFKFTGTTLRILGSKRIDGSNNIQITIDGNSEKISTKIKSVSNTDTSNIKVLLFEKQNLENKDHFVKISLVDDNYLMFTGVEINNDDRISHVNEVTNVEQLGIGRRIRCHYKASYNRVGEFSGLGEETKGFLPPESTAYPDGDFYFIMVDEVDGKKKLIADRNVQNRISCISIMDSLMKKNYDKNTFNRMIDLPTGGVDEDDKDNDWYKYIENNLYEIDWNYIDGITSWCGNFSRKYSERVVIRGKYFASDRWYGVDGNHWSHSNLVNTYSANGFRPILKINKNSV